MPFISNAQKAAMENALNQYCHGNAGVGSPYIKHLREVINAYNGAGIKPWEPINPQALANLQAIPIQRAVTPKAMRLVQSNRTNFSMVLLRAYSSYIGGTDQAASAALRRETTAYNNLGGQIAGGHFNQAWIVAATAGVIHLRQEKATIEAAIDARLTGLADQSLVGQLAEVDRQIALIPNPVTSMAEHFQAEYLERRQTRLQQQIAAAGAGGAAPVPTPQELAQAQFDAIDGAGVVYVNDDARYAALKAAVAALPGVVGTGTVQEEAFRTLLMTRLGQADMVAARDARVAAAAQARLDNLGGVGAYAGLNYDAKHRELTAAIAAVGGGRVDQAFLGLANPELVAVNGQIAAAVTVQLDGFAVVMGAATFAAATPAEKHAVLDANPPVAVPGTATEIEYAARHAAALVGLAGIPAATLAQNQLNAVLAGAAGDDAIHQALETEIANANNLMPVALRNGPVNQAFLGLAQADLAAVNGRIAAAVTAQLDGFAVALVHPALDFATASNDQKRAILTGNLPAGAPGTATEREYARRHAAELVALPPIAMLHAYGPPATTAAGLAAQVAAAPTKEEALKATVQSFNKRW